MNFCHRPQIRYLFPAVGGPLEALDYQLDWLVPVANPRELVVADAAPTYRAYFSAIHAMLESRLSDLYVITQQAGINSPIDALDIISEKHGSDYHPARVKIVAADGSVSLVVNVAISERGRQRLRSDFKCLARLSGESVPRVHFMAEQHMEMAGRDPVDSLMLVAEWFDDVHEFHVARNEKTRTRQLTLWNNKLGLQTLTGDQAGLIYRKIAAILASLFDPDTCREVYPWHHAAGDFIASVHNDKVDVRLITVRQYESRVHFDSDSRDNRLLGSALFLANLTIRIRLDRLDGIGDTVWVDDWSVNAAVQGFMDVMRSKGSHDETHRLQAHELVRWLKSLGPSELAELFSMVLDSYDPVAPDFQVVAENLADHVLAVYRCLQDESSSCI